MYAAIASAAASLAAFTLSALPGSAAAASVGALAAPKWNSFSPALFTKSSKAIFVSPQSDNRNADGAAERRRHVTRNTSLQRTQGADRDARRLPPAAGRM